MRGRISCAGLVFALMISPSASAAVCASGSTPRGLDASSYNGAIDWSAVQGSGRVFAYVRALDGTSTDPNFVSNFTGGKAAGLAMGAYLFFEPAQDPTAQANAFVSALATAGFASGDLIPAIDVEIAGGLSPATFAANLQTLVSALEAAYGTAPIISTSPGFWNTNVGSTAFSAEPLWVANWNVTCPTLPVGWTNWALWQFSGSDTVPGITGSTDGDYANGSLPVYTSSPVELQRFDAD